MGPINKTKRLLGLTLWMAAMLVAAAISRGASRADRSASLNPAPPPATPSSAAPLTADQAMLWKYVARCALPEGQELPAPDGTRFPGGLGLAPEWRDGACQGACQERVSACLFALTNPTGNHVQISLLSGAPGLPAGMAPGETDLPFTFQEGAFFGNVFSDEAYVCRGSDADKGPQVKRWCALHPELCNVLAPLVDAGSCQQACEMSCATLSDGGRRCVAVQCRDPKGRVWRQPITTYLRDRIEAGNADTIARAAARDTGLEAFEDGATALYRHVDFGRAPGAVHALVANVTASRPGGRIEVWLDGGRRPLGTLSVSGTRGVARDLRARLRTRGLSGPQDVVLKFNGMPGDTRVATVALR